MTREKIVEISKAVFRKWNLNDSPHEDMATAILAAIAEEKPKAPASLVEELKEWLRVNPSLCGSDESTRGFEWARHEVGKILSRYEQRKEVVLAEGKVAWVQNYEPDDDYGIGGFKVDLSLVDGKTGKLILVEDK